MNEQAKQTPGPCEPPVLPSMQISLGDMAGLSGHRGSYCLVCGRCSHCHADPFPCRLDAKPAAIAKAKAEGYWNPDQVEHPVLTDLKLAIRSLELGEPYHPLTSVGELLFSALRPGWRPGDTLTLPDGTISEA